MAAFIPALISGISGIAGGLLNKPKETKTTQNTTTNNTSNINSAQSGSSLPTYDPYQLQMRNYLLGQFYNNTNSSAIHGLVSGMTNNAVNDINASAGPQEQALKASLAARGLSYSGTAGTALAGQQQGRIGQILNTQAQAPILEHNLQQQGLTSFADYLAKLPVGSTYNTTGSQQGTQTGTSNMTGTNYDPGNVAGGAVAGFGGALAGLYGAGAFGGNKNTSSKIPGFMD